MFPELAGNARALSITSSWRPCGGTVCAALSARKSFSRSSFSIRFSQAPTTEWPDASTIRSSNALICENFLDPRNQHPPARLRLQLAHLPDVVAHRLGDCDKATAGLQSLQDAIPARFDLGFGAASACVSAAIGVILRKTFRPACRACHRSRASRSSRDGHQPFHP